MSMPTSCCRPQLLRAISDESLCRMQTALSRYYRAILWQQPFGPAHASAYDLVRITLCRRAKALAARYTSSGAHPMAFLARHQLTCPETLEAGGVRF